MVRPLIIAASLALAAGCQMPEPSGRHLYDRHCSACHGSDLRGGGPAGSDLPLAPPDLTLLSRDNDGVFPMADVIAQIHGYPGRYHQGLMPEFAPELPRARSVVTTPDGRDIAVPTAILKIARYLETRQQ